ncbi:MAG: DUF4286 family protein [Candidatus Kapabacteria bacterium]|jgi:hypothetical protein|nr:DUF4286 family protein [Candidatus Kapabacteria bacterium]
MILYRVQVVLQRDIYDDWLHYMLHDHIPEVLATGCFSGYSIARVVDASADDITVCISYSCASMSAYDRYQSQYAPALQANHSSRYGALVSASRIILTDDLSLDSAPTSASRSTEHVG